MGLIRKTTSIATLGIVPFRSKKELLRRANSAHQAAVADLQREQELREEADRRVSEAEKRRVAAELQSLAAAKQATKAKEKAKAKRRRRRPTTGERVATEAGKLGRRARVRAEKAARAADVEARRAARRMDIEARKAAKKAKATVEELKETAEPYAERGLDRARELGHDVLDAAGSTLTEVRQRAEERQPHRRRRRH